MLSSALPAVAKCLSLSWQIFTVYSPLFTARFPAACEVEIIRADRLADTSVSLTCGCYASDQIIW